MHSHHAGHYDITDLSTLDRIYHVIPSEDRALLNRARNAEAAAGSTTPAAPTPTQAVKAATADGKISEKEKTTFEGNKNATVLKNEEDRLKRALKSAGEADKTTEASTADGKNRTESATTTEHGKRVADLKAGKEDKVKVGDKEYSNDLNGLSDQIAKKKVEEEILGAGSMKEPIAALQEQVKTRKAEESKVVDVIRDKQQLVGTLEAEKLQIDSTRILPKDARGKEVKPETDDPNAEAKAVIGTNPQLQGAFDILNDNDGRKYDPDGAFGMGTDFEKTDDASWEQSIEAFEAHPDQLDKFAEAQDNATAEAAAKKIVEYSRQYLAIKESNDQADQKSKSIDTQITDLRETIAADGESLSAVTLGEMASTDRLTAQAQHQAENPDAADATSEPSGDDDDAGADDEAVVGDADGAGSNPNGPNAPDDAGADDEVVVGDADGAGSNPNGPNAPDDAVVTGADGAGGDEDVSDEPTADIPPAKTSDDVVREQNGLGAHYVVKPDDTLFEIAKRYSEQYEVEISYPQIAQANPNEIGDVDMIYPGQVFVIPGVQEKIDAQVKASQEAFEKAKADAIAAARPRTGGPQAQ